MFIHLACGWCSFQDSLLHYVAQQMWVRTVGFQPHRVTETETQDGFVFFRLRDPDFLLFCPKGHSEHLEVLLVGSNLLLSTLSWPAARLYYHVSKKKFLSMICENNCQYSPPTLNLKLHKFSSKKMLGSMNSFLEHNLLNL